ncbi:hypothetical protein GDO78_022290 [Eleutherodactylus coqui]|uniref:Olfactory receptor n=1 Tax=Eleutherodactylus coqui TaxID=57060 RepID=A0A8J6BGZ0_ELECQ|nr:hypothetical protein GDO78_022290 [Eleutherodactylus coqui]
MDLMNGTQVTVFVFSGLTDDKKLLPFLLILFSLIYIISIVISFTGCALQFFFYSALAASETLLLSTMSYDRYVAICHPLHYMSIITTKICLCLVSVAFSIGFLQSSVQTSCTFSLQFCGSNLIDHFYCDVLPVLKLSCANTFYCNMITLCCVGIGTIIPFPTIIFSYMLILSTVFHMTSAEGRKKTFSTCSSHLICASVFYLAFFFNYLCPPFSVSSRQDKVASVFYAVVTPMLNPLVYTLRNQEIRRAIEKAMHNPTSADRVSSVIAHKLGTMLSLWKKKDTTCWSGGM